MFKVGDRVKVVSACSFYGRSLGKIGTITDMNKRFSGEWIYIQFYDNSFDSGLSYDLEYAPEQSNQSNQSIINKTIMKVTNLVKRILDSDTQTLVEAGYINGELQLTDEGTSELLGLVFAERKAELVKLAQAKIEEGKK